MIISVIDLDLSVCVFGEHSFEALNVLREVGGVVFDVFLDDAAVLAADDVELDRG